MRHAVEPIRPDDVKTLKRSSIPDAVIEAFNELIAEHFKLGYSTFFQRDVVDRIVAKGLSVEELFTERWLDVEEIYRDSGWLVNYDKPGYNEGGEASFTFKVDVPINPLTRL